MSTRIDTDIATASIAPLEGITPAHVDEWTRITNEIVATIRSRVAVEQRRDALGVIASGLLTSGLDELGDAIGCTAEPVGSITDHVLNMFMVLDSGSMHTIDVRTPTDGYRAFKEAWDRVNAERGRIPGNTRTAIDDAADCSMDLATLASWEGCRLGAHLAVGLMNALGRADTLCIHQQRQVD